MPTLFKQIYSHVLQDIDSELADLSVHDPEQVLAPVVVPVMHSQPLQISPGHFASGCLDHGDHSSCILRLGAAVFHISFSRQTYRSNNAQEGVMIGNIMKYHLIMTHHTSR